jgi:hypothetical protein
MRKFQTGDQTVSARILAAILIAGIVILDQAGMVQAQNPQVRQLERIGPATQPQTNALEVVGSKEAEESGDLGKQVILQTVPRVRMFEIFSDTQVIYDSNPLLVRNQEKADGLLYQTFQLSFTPHLVDKLVTSMYLRYQFIRYFDNSRFDFDALGAGLNLGYPVLDWLTAYGGWSAERLDEAHGGNTFYEEYDTQLGLRASFPLGKRANYFFGYQFDWRPSDPHEFNRVDHFAFLGLNLQLIEKLTAQFLYRFRYEDYLEDSKVLVDLGPPVITTRKSRSDIENLVSFALVYPFNEYVNVRAYVLYSNNDSTRRIFDYDVVNVGGGLNLSFRF